MPLLYVHGVATRREDDPEHAELQRVGHELPWADIEGRLREEVAPALNPQHPERVVVRPLYWGDLGTKSPPRVDQRPSRLPDLAAASPAEVGRALEHELRQRAPLAAWPDVVEVAYAVPRDPNVMALVTSLPPGEQWDTLHAACVGRLRARWQADGHPQVRPWLLALQADWHQRLRADVTHLRSPLEAFTPFFLGDMLSFARDQGTPEQPGPMARRVLDRMREMHHLGQETGEPLVLLAHSMGGQLLFDALSACAPHDPELRNLKIDVLCVCGSQVGLFAAMGLFMTQRTGEAAVPPSVRLFWNVWSSYDVMSFPAAPHVAGAYDTMLPLTRNALHAHMRYLTDETFYRLLAAHVRTSRRADTPPNGRT